jgi:hypothetical protein
MAVLTYKKRKSLPSSKFAVVKKVKGKEVKKFPITDKAHARNALSRVNQAKGLSKSEKSQVIKKAEKKLGKESSIKVSKSGSIVKRKKKSK